MNAKTTARINIYLDEPSLHAEVRLAAARQGITLSAYCTEAIRRRLESERAGAAASRAGAAEDLDRLRNRLGPIGVPVTDLIAEGRR